MNNFELQVPRCVVEYQFWRRPIFFEAVLFPTLIDLHTPSLSIFQTDPVSRLVAVHFAGVIYPPDHIPTRYLILQALGDK